MTTLTLKEQRAVEYRYLGVPHKEIASKLTVPKETVDGWFKKRGPLLSPYQFFSADINKKRQEKIEEQLYILDREWLTTFRLLLIRFNELLLHGHKTVLTQNGEPLLDENGKVQYYYKHFIPKFADFYRAWKMQRIMRGLPTNIREKRCPGCKTITHTML